MSKFLVMTVIGPDRPGLVDSLASAVARHQGSWLESRMAHLAGSFAGIVRVECPDSQSAALTAALGTLEGLSVNAVEESPAERSPSETLHFDVLGNDRPGIIKQLAAAIAAAGGNVEELNSDLESAPMSGHPVFRATGTIAVPPGFNPDTLANALEELGPDLSVSLAPGD